MDCPIVISLAMSEFPQPSPATKFAGSGWKQKQSAAHRTRSTWFTNRFYRLQVKMTNRYSWSCYYFCIRLLKTVPFGNKSFFNRKVYCIRFYDDKDCDNNPHLYYFETAPAPVLEASVAKAKGLFGLRDLRATSLWRKDRSRTVFLVMESHEQNFSGNMLLKQLALCEKAGVY